MLINPQNMKNIADILPQTGRVAWIGLRPRAKAPLEEVSTATVSIEQGLEGDHYRGSSRKRQLTLIQGEHLEAVAHLLGVDRIDPLQTRRNIVVTGINLLAFAGRQFEIGDAILLFTDYCEPCERMEQNLGPGGYNAMQGHGGICARVIRPGKIAVGDAVRLLAIPPEGEIPGL